MRKLLLTFLLTIFVVIHLIAQQMSYNRKGPDKIQFISFSTLNGFVMPTNTYVTQQGGPTRYSALALKYGFSSKGDCWEDIAYGMPYGGIGIYGATFRNGEDRVGVPVSFFVFQGGQLARLNSKITFNYEWNLGISFGWIPYDAFDNPDNIAIGSTVNAHISFDFYLKWYLSPAFDLNFGLNLSHFSNGDSRLPNAGFNLAAPALSLVYNFNRKRLSNIYGECELPPLFHKHIDHDVSMTITARQAQIDTAGTGIPSPYLDRKFKVLGLGYAMLFANSYRYKWGPGLDLVYDESSAIRAWRQLNLEDGKVYDRIRLGSTSKRFSLGLSVKGELTMPRYSIFANVGWNMIYGNRSDTRLYQILGIKVYLKENLFGTFGIRASHFSSAQYLYWSLGYTIPGKQRGGRN